MAHTFFIEPVLYFLYRTHMYTNYIPHTDMHSYCSITDMDFLLHIRTVLISSLSTSCKRLTYWSISGNTSFVKSLIPLTSNPDTNMNPYVQLTIISPLDMKGSADICVGGGGGAMHALKHLSIIVNVMYILYIYNVLMVACYWRFNNKMWHTIMVMYETKI